MYVTDTTTFRIKKTAAGNKNYMSIGVSVRTTKFAARNNGIGVRQESNPQSPTAYSSARSKQWTFAFILVVHNTRWTI